MSLAKLVVHLQANYKGLTAGLGIARNDIAKTVAHVARVAAQLDTMKGKLDEIAPEYETLKELSAAFAESTDLAGKSADLLRIKLRYIADTMAVLQGQTVRYEQTLSDAVATFQLRLLTDALRRQSQATDTIRRMWNGNNNALVRYNQTAAQTTLMHDTMAQSRPAIVQQSQNRSMIRSEGGGNNTQTLLQVTAIALQAKSASVMERAMTRARTAVATVGEAIRSVSTVTAQSVSAMDRFRMAAIAPKTDPSLNVVKNGVEKVGDVAAAAVDKLRGMADATIEGIPDTLGQIAKSGAKLSGELDKTSATMSKHISRGQTMSKGLKLLSVVFPFAAKAIAPLKSAVDTATAATERGAQKVEAASAVIASGANKARNAQFVLTGTFQKLGGTADLFARGQYHAMLPARLLKREIEGSMRVVRAATTVWNFATHPIHKLSLAAARGKADFQAFRQTLPPLTQGLQLGVRAYRAFAHATYGSSIALSGLKTAATPVVWVGKQIWNLVRPAKAAKAGLDGVATGGQRAGIVLRGVTAAAGGTVSALTRVASAGTKVAANSGSGFLSALPGKAAMATTAVVGIVLAMAGLCVQTAMATEKNEALFGTMVHDLEQGKAIVASIQNTEAAAFFDNQSLLDSSRLLYKAGVATTDLAGKTDQFAKIAVGASVDMNLLTDRYMQGANQRKFGLGQINDLAREGVAIYDGLAAATGASGDALQKMIADGQIGITEMDAALAYLTEGHGIYADALTNVGNTTSGMLSQIKNNVTQALGAVMGVANSGLAPALASVVTLTASIKEHASSITPVVTQVTETIKAAFVSVYEVGATAWTSLFGVAQTSVSGMLTGTMQFVTKFRWFFSNLVPLVQFVGLKMLSTLLGVFNDMVYWITTKIPAYLTWFADNWQAVFRDLAAGTMTVFQNLGTNIKNAMGVIWEFIKSGGTANLEFTWTPLLDGFKATMAELPNIPERPMTAMEQGMQEQIETIGTELADSFDAMMADATTAMASAAVVPELVPSVSAPAGGDPMAEDQTKAATAEAKQAENKAVTVRSEEGQKVMADLLRRGLQGDKKTTEQLAKDSRDLLADIRRNTENAPKFGARKFGGA